MKNLKIKLILIVTFSVTMLIGCSDDDNNNNSSIVMPFTPSSTVMQWETEGFSMPESVYASSDHEWLYVSNVNGVNPGFISRLNKNGEIDNLTWVNNLNSPTGMDVYNNKLYVIDRTVVHVINVSTGELESDITGTGIISLNDISISDDGEIFISDIVGGKIYTVENNGLTIKFEFTEIPFPNGVFVQDDNLIIANYGTVLQPNLTEDQYGSLYSVSLLEADAEPVNIGNQLGGLDGISQIQNTLLVSSNPTGELFYVLEDDQMSLGILGVGLADIGTGNEILYAPFLNDNKVVAYTFN